MSENERKPSIRFAGFDDAWEQRKLSEIATMHARIGWQNLRTSEFLDSGDYLLITGTDFDDGAINYATCHYVERERYEQDRHIQIRNGSILITKDGTLGKVAYVQDLSMPATLNAGVFNVEIRDDLAVDPKYVYQYLKAPFLMDYVVKKATGGTIKHLNQNILVDFPVALPERKEQGLIGGFFLSIDNLITLHQRKYDKLVSVKKSMLEKMFPKNGSNKPEIRFSGFTDPWEQRKLSELGKVLTGNTPPTSERENWAKDENGYVWITPTDINALRMSDSERHLTAVGWGKARYVPSNSVLITSIASIGKNAINTVPAAFNQQINAIIPIENSAYFILTAMENEKARFAGLAGKTATAIINKTEFEKFSFFIPKLQEQERISGFFENLDNLITLHQRELEKLKNIKKSMLEKMFV